MTGAFTQRQVSSNSNYEDENQMTMSIERTQIGGKTRDMTHDRIDELKSIQMPNAIFSPRELSQGNQNYERLGYLSYRATPNQSVEL